MKILYVNAMTEEVGGEAYAAGLINGIEASNIVRKTGMSIEIIKYNLFYGDIQPAQLMGRFARQHDVDAVILSGSAKNTTDIGDPFLAEYYQGLRDLLSFQSEVHEWTGPRWPVFGICFGHQALAAALGGETSKFSLNWGPKKMKLLPRAFYHPMIKPLLAECPGSSLDLVVYHADQVVRVPNGFYSFMTSPYCEVQAMAHDQWPIVSFQAHPEASAKLKDDLEDSEYWKSYSDEDLNAKDGWRLLGKFIDWAVKK